MRSVFQAMEDPDMADRRSWALRLRDRDDIITPEGLIMRVLGYDHPPGAWFCEPLYAPCSIFRSSDPRAPRLPRDGGLYLKFYGDEGWRFVMEHWPAYRLRHKPLGADLVGVREGQVKAVRRTDEGLRALLASGSEDPLARALVELLDELTGATGLRTSDFGVFGSLLHGFYHPLLSDLDLVVYGLRALRAVREALAELYSSGERFKNEFGPGWSYGCRDWPWAGISPEEFRWHQARKLIYGFFLSREAGRWVKFELEPVRSWPEITNRYDPSEHITKLGWALVRGRVADASGAPFTPAVYGLEEAVFLGEPPPGAREPELILCYVDEFRLQAFEGEELVAAGWLEHVEGPRWERWQLVLTYGPRYHEQFIKLAGSGASNRLK